MWNDVKCNFILIFHGGHTSLVHNYQQWIRFHSGTRRLGALQALSETWNINGQLFFLLIKNCGLVYIMGILWWQNAIELGYDMIWYDMTWYDMGCQHFEKIERNQNLNQKHPQTSKKHQAPYYPCLVVDFKLKGLDGLPGLFGLKALPRFGLVESLEQHAPCCCMLHVACFRKHNTT